MNRRNIFIIAGAIMATLILILIILLIQQLINEKRFKFSKPFATGMRFAEQVDADHIDYFDGSVFRRLTISTQSSDDLARFKLFPNIIAVKWGKDAVLFQASNYQYFDALYPLLESRKLDTSRSYWWKFDFKTDNLYPIGVTEPLLNQSVYDASWAPDGKSYYYISSYHYGDDGPAIGIYNVVNDQIKSLGDTDAIKIDWVGNGILMYSNSSGDVIELNAKTGNKKTILKSFVGRLSFNSSGNAALAIAIANTANTGEGIRGARGELRHIDISTGKITKIADSFAGDIEWLDDSNWIAIGRGQSAGNYIGSGTSSKSLVIDKGDNQLSPTDLEIAGFLDADGVALIEGDGTGYLAGTKVPNFKKVNTKKTADISLSGTNDMTLAGFTSSDIAACQFAFAKYANKISAEDTSVSISGFRQAPIDRSRTTNSTDYYFNAAFAGKSLSIKATYSDLAVWQFIFSENGKQIFDSDLITDHNRY